METAYGEFKTQHPHTIPATVPYTPTGSNREPVPPLTGKVTPPALLLASNEAKPTKTTIIHHGALLRIPKHHMTPQDLPAVPGNSEQMPRTSWACDPNAPTSAWPV